MKKNLIAFLILFSTVIYGQDTIPNNFKIGNYLELFGNDSLKIYFSCTGYIVDKNCALYYRVGKIDSTIINFLGKFSDYDMKGNIVFSSSIYNNNLEGFSQYYYENGQVKEEGKYENNLRAGIWKYYFSNGQIEKILNFAIDDVYLLEAYSVKGKPKVIKGNGSYTLPFTKHGQCDNFEASGNVINGRKNGDWKFSNIKAISPIAIETYDNGKFISGISNNYIYNSNPKIDFIKFYSNENLNLIENSFDCPGKTISAWGYKNENSHIKFFPELNEILEKCELRIKNQWLIIGLKINNKNMLSEVNVASSINEKNFESYIYNSIMKMKDWQAVNLNNRKVETNIYFSILVDNSKAIILTNYLFNNRKFDE